MTREDFKNGVGAVAGLGTDFLVGVGVGKIYSKIGIALFNNNTMLGFVGYVAGAIGTIYLLEKSDIPSKAFDLGSAVGEKACDLAFDFVDSLKKDEEEEIRFEPVA